MKKKLSFSQNLIWNSLGSFVYLICQWLLTLIVVRLSSDFENAGNLSLAISITNIFFTIACFNVRPYLVSDINHKYTTKEYSGFRVLSCILSLILCLGYISAFSYGMKQLLTIMLYMIFKLGEAYVDLLHGIEQREDRMDIGAISLILRGISLIVSFSVILYLTDNINLSIIGMIFITFLIIVFYDIRKCKYFGNIIPEIKITVMKKLSLELMPLLIGALVNTLSTNIPRQILEKVMGTNALGIYATVATPAAIVQVASSYIFNPLQTVFANYKNEEKYLEFKNLLLKTSIILLGLSIICCIGVVLFGKWGLMLLYGNNIGEYSYLLLPIIIFSALNGYVWFLSNVIIVLRKNKELLIIDIIGLIMSLILTRFFINQFGMNGISFVMIIFSIIIILCFYYVILRGIKEI